MDCMQNYKVLTNNFENQIKYFFFYLAKVFNASFETSADNSTSEQSDLLVALCSTMSIQY